MNTSTASIDATRRDLMNGQRLARQLRRMLADGPFGPMIFWLKDGGRIDVSGADDVRAEFTDGIIKLSVRDGMREIPFESLLALELRPRVPR
jgi:hypothetical protein